MSGPLPKQIRALQNDGSQAPVGYVMTSTSKGVFKAAEAAGGAFTGDTIEMAVTQVLDFSGNVRNNVQVLFPWGSPEKLADPSFLPATQAVGGVAWSPNGEFLAVARDDNIGPGPFLTIYQRTSQTFNKVTDPVALPGNFGQDVAWSPDGEFLVIAHSTTSPFVTIYHRSGAIFTKLADPGTLPTGNGRDVTWSPNGEFLVIGHDITPFITIYQRTGIGTSAVFTKLANPTLPFNNCRGAAFSPNGEFLATAGQGGFLNVYQVSGATFTKLTDPTPQPGGSGTDVAWSPDSRFLAVARVTSPFVVIYQRSGTTFTKLSDLSPLPAGLSQDVTWSPSGEFLAVAHGTTPFITIYQFDGVTFTKLADPAALPTGIGEAVQWSPSGEFLAITHATTPYITIYQTGLTMPVSGAVIINREFKAGT